MICDYDTSYNGNTKCTNCESGYYYNLSTFVCDMCEESCAICHTGDECIYCEENYKLNTDGKCILTHVDNCANFDEATGTCTSCNTGYYMENSTSCPSC